MAARAFTRQSICAAAFATAACVSGFATTGDITETADRTVRVEFPPDAPVIEGHGASAVLEYDAAFTGRLYVSVQSVGDSDPFVRAFDTSDRPLGEDDNSGGALGAFVRIDVIPARHIRIVIARGAASSVTSLLVKIASAPETADSKAALAHAEETLSAVSKLRSSNRYADARSAIDALIDELFAIEGCTASDAWTAALESSGLDAYHLQCFDSCLRAWRQVLAHRSRTLTDENPYLQQARQNLAAVLLQLHDFESAQPLQEQVLEVAERALSADDSQLQWFRANAAVLRFRLGDRIGAYTLQASVLDSLLRTLPSDAPDVQSARLNLAGYCESLGDLDQAYVLGEQALDVFLRTADPDDSLLQKARSNLAGTQFAFGELHEALALQSLALHVQLRTLPHDSEDVQMARQNLAATLKMLGDLDTAFTLEAEAVEVRKRKLRPDDRELLALLNNHADTIKQLGDLDCAIEMQRDILDRMIRALRDDDPLLQLARLNLASTFRDLGNFAEAYRLQALVVEARSRELPPDHPDFLVAQMSLANSLADLGNVEGASTILRTVLDALDQQLPVDHPVIQAARVNYGGTLLELGHPIPARVLIEDALSARLRRYDEDHPDVLSTQLTLASVAYTLGNYLEARALVERVVSIQTRRLPDDHPDVQLARSSHAIVLDAIGDHEAAASLMSSVLDGYSRRLPSDHPYVLASKQSYATALLRQGNAEVAIPLLREVFEERSRVLRPSHLDVLLSKRNLGVALAASGKLTESRAMLEDTLVTGLSVLPDDHPDLEALRINVVTIAAWTGDFDAARKVAFSLCSSGQEAIRTAILAHAPNELIQRCKRTNEAIATVLSVAAGAKTSEASPDLDARAFELLAALRGVELRSARIMRKAGSEHAALRSDVMRATDWLAALARSNASVDALRDAIADRDTAQRALLATASARADLRSEFEAPTMDAITSRLGADQALIVYWRGRVLWFDDRDSNDSDASDRFLAFIVRPDGSLTRFDLGPAAAVVAAAHAWRRAIGEASQNIDARGEPVRLALDPAHRERMAGATLGAIVIDPLRRALAGTTHWTVCLDDVLHTVPFDALPTSNAADADRRIGDDYRIEVRTSIHELLLDASNSVTRPSLLAIGATDFDEAPTSWFDAEPRVASVRTTATAPEAGQPYASWPQHFKPLRSTAEEARRIHDVFCSAFGLDPMDTCARILDGSRASRAGLVDLAPHARIVHVATHGWFAPESVSNTGAPAPVDALLGVGSHMSPAWQLISANPMTLCGIALAGANLPPDRLGRRVGVVTADEIASWKLDDCDLAVLSACNTQVGVNQNGHGVASLQRALQMAGARMSVTSLWSVPDQSTQDLMVRFYEGLWLRGLGARESLWAAKKAMREALDDEGNLKYSAIDWAGWVLTGESK